MERESPQTHAHALKHMTTYSQTPENSNFHTHAWILIYFFTFSGTHIFRTTILFLVNPIWVQSIICPACIYCFGRIRHSRFFPLSWASNSKTQYSSTNTEVPSHSLINCAVWRRRHDRLHVYTWVRIYFRIRPVPFTPFSSLNNTDFNSEAVLIT